MLLLLATLALADEPSGFVGLVPGVEPRAPRPDGTCPKGWVVSEGVRCCPAATVFEPASRTCVAEPLLGGLRGTTLDLAVVEAVRLVRPSGVAGLDAWPALTLDR